MSTESLNQFIAVQDQIDRLRNGKNVTAIQLEGLYSKRDRAFLHLDSRQEEIVAEALITPSTDKYPTPRKIN